MDFISNYEESVERFKNACSDAILKSYPIGDHEINVAHFDRSGPCRLVIQAGLHGAEGYAGSAAIIDTIEQVVGKSDWSFSFIHGANPKGMAEGTRLNQNYVDLNRAFASDLEHSNPGYNTLVDILNPKHRFTGKDAINLIKTFVEYKKSGRVNELKEAIAMGQREHPGLLFYIGQRGIDEPEVINLKKIYKRIAEKGQPFIFLDIHTGFFLNEQLIGFVPQAPGTQKFDLIDKLFESSPLTSLEQPDEGFRAVGSSIDYVDSHYENALVMAPEFGTVGSKFSNGNKDHPLYGLDQTTMQLSALIRLVAGLQNRHYSTQESRLFTPSYKSVALAERRLFLPDSKKWQKFFE